MDKDIPWWFWCRLCAKEDFERNMSVASDIAMKTAIGRYFWVNIKDSDPTHHICQDCYRLMNQLLFFTERVNKVQAMLTMLQNASSSEPFDLYDLRSRYDLLDEDFVHMAKETSAKEENFFQDAILDDDSENAPHFVEENDDFKEEKKCNEETEKDDEDIQENEPNADDETIEGNDAEIKIVPLIEENEECAMETEEKDEDENSEKGNENNFQLDSLEDGPKYVCCVCGRNYKNVKPYKKHMLWHNIEPELPEFNCEKCNKAFPTIRQMMLHSRTHLPLDKKLLVPCTHCDKKFTMESVMKLHFITVHLNQRPYTCDKCGSKFKTLGSFNDHKLTHSNYYPYECKICQKKFKQNVSYKYHMDTHTETRHECPKCGVELNTKRTLRMHMLVHSDKKAFKCKFCDAEFKRGKALKNHILVHMGLRPYKCNFCEKTFTNGSNCRSHKKRFHPLQLAEEEAAGIKTEPINVPRISELLKRNVENIKRVGLQNGYPRPHLIQSEVAPDQCDKSVAAPKNESNENEVNNLDNLSTADAGEGVQYVLQNCYQDGNSILSQYDQYEETFVYELINDSER